MEYESKPKKTEPPPRTFSKTGLSRTGWFLTPNDKGFDMSKGGIIYHKDSETGTWKRAIKKVRGKSARKADKAARRVTCRTNSIAASVVKTST